MATYERLDYGSDDGSQWGGASTDKLSFYGVTPVTRYTLVGAASTYVSGSCNGGTSGYIFGFTTDAMVTSLIYQVSTMTLALRSIGLIV